jgi:hypothetical protein
MGKIAMTEESEKLSAGPRFEPGTTCVISGVRRDVDEICTLLGYYTRLSGSSVPTFRDNLSVKKSKNNS